jgi:hypothetical protein
MRFNRVWIKGRQRCKRCGRRRREHRGIDAYSCEEPTWNVTDSGEVENALVLHC